ncbi:MAG: alpha-amylase [Candidatus Microsaccharimonas sossegonensis]|uniref:Alpha-amylase n=1 Tax=Candidatus Microsaccharimonas sossegonensis TaxID=2506948 RepID=A0A4Q0AH30_9BACT|nr:MAG: alpha-amylase [Candidatus Microsaccharimonas sossegonensis]
MTPHPTPPIIYEINTPIFLHEIGQRVGYPVTLAEVPDKEWDAIARPGVSMVWLMGVWKRSSLAREMAKDEPWLKKTLPDMQPEDLLGSAYSIQDYTVDELYGGNEALAVARRKLKERGIGIMLDYVPNHVGIDHRWVTEHPNYFLPGTEHELAKHPEAFVQTAGGIFAKGKDPNFDPWSDVLQLNAFSEGLRNEVISTLSFIASISDGVRCDMAMLMMNTIFKSTWGTWAGPAPATDYWPHIITAVREKAPDFLFLAEVYWDKQQDLLGQGFDFCYDKDLYDDLLEGSVHRIRNHLQAPVAYQNHLLRFLENHDEERAAKEFTVAKQMAAAVIIATLPGAHLYHDGQREGRLVKVPVHVGRRVDEPVNEAIALFYDKLWAFIAQKNFVVGEWNLLHPLSRFWHRPSHHVLAWEWTRETQRYIIAVNYSPQKAHVALDIDRSKVAHAEDILNGHVNWTEYIDGTRLALDAWQHIVITLEK